MVLNYDEWWRQVQPTLQPACLCVLNDPDTKHALSALLELMNILTSDAYKAALLTRMKPGSN